jgi:ADP-heptose:LPS heptosyltransferase
LKRLGDLVLTTPALELLARQGDVTLGVFGSASELLPAIPQIRGAIIFGRGKGWTPWQQVIWGRFDRVVDFTGTDRSALISFLSRAPRRITFTRAKSGWLRRLPYHELIDSPVRDQHTIEHYTELAASCANPEESGRPRPESLIEAPREPRLQVPPDVLAKAQALRQNAGLTGDYAVIHAGTARPEKYWLAERWAEVIAHLYEAHGLRCILTGGQAPEEKAHLAAIEAAVRERGVRSQSPTSLTGPTSPTNLSPAPLNLAGQHDLLTLAALISEASIVLSVDTVTVHLAAAFQRPQVALFGPTNPFHWRPRHSKAVVFSAAQPEMPITEFTPRMKGAPMDRLSTAPVIRATDALLFH